MYKISLVVKDMDGNILNEIDIKSKFTNEYKEGVKVITNNNFKDAYVQLLLDNIKENLSKEDIIELIDGIK